MLHASYIDMVRKHTGTTQGALARNLTTAPQTSVPKNAFFGTDAIRFRGHVAPVPRALLVYPI